MYDDEFYCFEDFEPGDRFEGETRLQVTEAEIRAFAERFDPQPFHLDAAAAAESLFGELIASGWHTAAMTMRLLVDSGIPIRDGWVGMGVEALSWPAPSRPGDTLRLELEVLEKTPSRSRPQWGVVKFRLTTLNQSDRVVYQATPRCWVRRRSQ